MKRYKGESLISADAARQAIAQLPQAYPFIYEYEGHGYMLHVRRAWRWRYEGWNGFTPNRKLELTGGLTVAVTRVTDARVYSRTYRLSPGWSEAALSRAIERARVDTLRKQDIGERRYRAQARFEQAQTDALVAVALAWAESIGWDGVYDTATTEQLEKFEAWMTEQGLA